jgi:DNA-binding NtrC family response regulator
VNGSSERVLIADDEEVLRRNLAEFVERAGYSVTTAADGEEALARVREEDYAVLIADLRMPRLDGISLLKQVVAERPETLVLLTTGFASIESVVEALRLGAYDYLLKPVLFEDVVQKIQNLVAYRALKQEVVRLRRDLHARGGYEGIVGESPLIRGVFEHIERVAPTRSTVLITGESGTGKELVARAIHARSGLRDRQFVALNMAALPSEIVEAQLFGHEKGAFTGAAERRDGVLRAARGGTVFLDEIGDLALPTQGKLLRALESHEVLPVGADRPVTADFRMIAATNQDLARLIADGRFRQDLFYRLNVFRIELPPLRDRREDIPRLVAHFVGAHTRAMGRRPPRVANEAMKALLSYPWPGNIRELSNVLERAIILAGEVIEPAHLPLDLRGGNHYPTELRPAVEEFERRHIAFALGAASGNRERAARLLDIDPATLYRRLLKYDLH